MAKLNKVKVLEQKVYDVTLTQDEVELILLLIGDVNDGEPGVAAGSIWDELDNAARGTRVEYIIGGKTYRADVNVELVQV
jgi:hypothetical protein